MNPEDPGSSARFNRQPLVNAGDDEAAAREFAPVRSRTMLLVARFEDPCAAQTWRVAQSLITLRDQINALAPRRRKDSDGTIGDAAHCGRESDHNPHVRNGAMGIVTALDITHDIAGGCNCAELAERLQHSHDVRIKYVIWNRRMYSSYAHANDGPWVWRPYAGENPHDKHMHVSVVEDERLYDDTTPWIISST
ncbi:hypothetical protein [Luteibacter sp. UNCMF366Tsu5.1]|uniref:hypothetical protein n=1 Tax=Luteibacter sp. UNCMF366Tsu5.1 TaxID=1502758 RepID=UPI000908510D|nr:hypothetical protein [Luteibacter sp. UNCMF366Tsu5.1]SFW28280.1 hypothetical protein SAMN02800691_0756 [Luteibacter sp. UNCMF366Tsu5.1]